MTNPTQTLLKDIQTHNQGNGFLLACLEMKYAILSARGDFGSEGLEGALNDLKEAGEIQYEKRGQGIDKKTYVVAAQ